ncbi:alpha/beta fold hydrolase [Rhizobium sp. C4]|uniref:alpha/beta fold hydrolase n=1 Tax=Rhizobium sp. C4 TaxID=1349800 RepID=UPI001E3AB0D1|nr:alpha/beta fold hydrolase [Rhizobium sp. C4]MCD2172269.1 alpha/beta fold hydrolase [Rhizobium sp. C4]
MVWRIWGKGPAVVLLHGGHGSWMHWIRNIPELSKHHTVYIPNLPGMGGSVAVGRTMEQIAAAVIAGVEQLRIPAPYALGGFSFGSVVAAYMLDAHRDRINHLVLVGTAGLGKVDLVTSSLKHWREISDPVERRAIHAFNLSKLMLFKPESIDALAVDIQTDNAEQTIVNNRKAAMEANTAAVLDRHPALPITAIWGQEDALVRRHLEERITFLSARHPPGQTHVIPGVGHWVQFEAAGAVNAILIDALRQTSGAPHPTV